VENCTITGNLIKESDVGGSGGGIHGSAATTISNCIIWGNSAVQLAGSPAVFYSDVQGGQPGTGNIDSDPLFVSGPKGDYYLSQVAAGQAVESPCADAGSDLAVYLGIEDCTTRTDHIGDADIVDMGYHYGECSLSAVHVLVPSVLGDTLVEAILNLSAVALNLGSVSYDYSHSVPVNLVISQYPAGGAEVPVRSSVVLVVSLGAVPYRPGDVDYDRDVDWGDYALFAYDCGFGDVNTIARGSVEVDGDFIDWPANTEWKLLDEVYSGTPNDVNSAKFALLWDPNTDKVYAAVVVDDTDHVFTDDYISWDASDRIEIYSQGDAEGGSGWYGVYDAAQHYMVGPNTSGGVWTSWGDGSVLASNAGLERAVAKYGGRIVYEIGVQMFDNYGGISGGDTIVTDLDVGDVVGIDLVASTRRSGGFGMLSENLLTGKYNDADQFALYLLVEHVGCADLDGDGANTLKDVRILAENWLAGKGTKGGFVAWWKLDEGAGFTAYDAVGAHQGNVHGAVWTAGQVGGALQFDGLDDYVNCGGLSSLLILYDITVTAWVKVEEDSRVQAIIGQSPGSHTADTPYLLRTDASAPPRVVFERSHYGPDDYEEIVSTDAISLDNWHFVAATVENRFGTIYIDGNPSGIHQFTIDPSTHWFDTRIGAASVFGEYFHGSIDEVRIYNRALSSEEITEIYLADGN
jgi:hypothetical protein